MRSEDRAETQAGTLASTFAALRRHWALVLLVSVPLVFGATVYAEILPSTYDGVAVVSFSPRAGRAIGADVVRILLPKYSEFVSSRPTMERIGAAVGESATSLESAVDVSIASETSNLRIRARLDEPAQAARVANLFAAEAVRLSASDQLLIGSVVVPASRPREPSGPPRRLIEATALLVAATLGSGLAFLVERLRPQTRTVAEVATETGYTILGRIPRSDVARDDPFNGLDDPLIGTSLRIIRTNLDRERAKSPAQTIVVTSPTPQDGKTTVSVLLAEALSRLDSVLLVDGDLARPALASWLGVAPKRGLAAVLRGASTLKAAVQERNGHFGILLSMPDAEGEDLITREFDRVMQEAAKTANTIIVDAPPLLSTGMARVLSTRVDGVVLVVAAGTPAGSVREAADVLDQLGARVLGVVMNVATVPTSTYTM